MLKAFLFLNRLQSQMHIYTANRHRRKDIYYPKGVV